MPILQYRVLLFDCRNHEQWHDGMTANPSGKALYLKGTDGRGSGLATAGYLAGLRADVAADERHVRASGEKTSGDFEPLRPRLIRNDTISIDHLNPDNTAPAIKAGGCDRGG
jgi:hypothetical protein